MKKKNYICASLLTILVLNLEKPVMSLDLGAIEKSIPVYQTSIVF